MMREKEEKDGARCISYPAVKLPHTEWLKTTTFIFV